MSKTTWTILSNLQELHTITHLSQLLLDAPEAGVLADDGVRQRADLVLGELGQHGLRQQGEVLEQLVLIEF